MRRWVWEGGGGVGFVMGNVWSRSARRKVQRGTPSAERMGATEEEQLGTSAEQMGISAERIGTPAEQEVEEETKFGFRIQVRDMGMTAQVDIEWRWGRDVVLFESFCGKVKGIVQQSQS